MQADAEVNMADRRELMKVDEGGGPQHVLVTHAVLTGLTPLIPVSLVDDLVKSYFRKRLVRTLAASVGRDTLPFKDDVRKLKSLGLTISHSPGYELSPRGQALLRRLEA
jgi:hypothetical protein